MNKFLFILMCLIIPFSGYSQIDIEQKFSENLKKGDLEFERQNFIEAYKFYDLAGEFLDNSRINEKNILKKKKQLCEEGINKLFQQNKTQINEQENKQIALKRQNLEITNALKDTINVLKITLDDHRKTMEENETEIRQSLNKIDSLKTGINEQNNIMSIIKRENQNLITAKTQLEQEKSQLSQEKNNIENQLNQTKQENQNLITAKTQLEQEKSQLSQEKNNIENQLNQTKQENQYSITPKTQSQQNDLDTNNYEVSLNKKLHINQKNDSINLSNHDLIDIPVKQIINKQLTELYLANNKISKIDTICSFTELLVLVLSYNAISTLPLKISNLQNLSQLYINNNKLEILPRSFIELKNLESLNLKNNQLKKFPQEITYLKQLKILSLSNNNFNEISQEIGNLIELNELYLENLNLEYIPNSIQNCKSLQLLKLSGNNLSLDEKNKLKSILPNCNIVW